MHPHLPIDSKHTGRSPTVHCYTAVLRFRLDGRIFAARNLARLRDTTASDILEHSGGWRMEKEVDCGSVTSACFWQLYVSRSAYSYGCRDRLVMLSCHVATVYL